MPDARTHDITALLLEWRGGNQAAVNRLLPRIYTGLRRDRSRPGTVRHAA